MRSALVEPGEIKTAICGEASAEIDDFDTRLTGPLRTCYGDLVTMMRGFAAEGARIGAEPELVAAAVEHALSARLPKARYLAGCDAKAGGLISRLPDRAREGLVNRNVGHLERAGRKL
jgi:hypothetical protein